ncbi:MAG: hypothetical protein ACI4PP_01400 [Clostridia bacterium]
MRESAGFNIEEASPLFVFSGKGVTFVPQEMQNKSPSCICVPQFGQFIVASSYCHCFIVGQSLPYRRHKITGLFSPFEKYRCLIETETGTTIFSVRGRRKTLPYLYGKEKIRRRNFIFLGLILPYSRHICNIYIYTYKFIGSDRRKKQNHGLSRYGAFSFLRRGLPYTFPKKTPSFAVKKRRDRSHALTTDGQRPEKRFSGRFRFNRLICEAEPGIFRNRR